MSEPQVWKLAISPAQRWVLLKLAHEKGQVIKGQQGRVFRRFMDAFGLTIIDETIREKGKVSAATASRRTTAIFTVTAENIDYAKALIEVEHSPSDETIVGPLFDALDSVKSSAEPAGVPFAPESEDWAPVAEMDPDSVGVAVDKIVESLTSFGYTEAAALVRSGCWDAPVG